MTNAVVHVELIGPEPDRLRAFYAALFGWDSPAGAPVAAAVSDQSSYSFLDPVPGSGPVAGGIGGGPEFTAHAVFYVGVEDVAAALARAEDLGGTVVLPAQRNEGGGVTIGHFHDLAGNLVGVAGPR
ncbi:VOC family protein [Curtobacterium poinsettiae]|uniref:VOC family protein n=1 Tax=Curtobacterium poinsettiae TaxID=159612 RepID=UPI0023617B21|nr:VOC family protein [Curtobacterium flaccumfaciens]MDD1383776.1 VOC family protein [Curtobacterium flaccumfaciens pv. poinsettiae]